MWRGFETADATARGKIIAAYGLSHQVTRMHLPNTLLKCAVMLKQQWSVLRSEYLKIQHVTFLHENASKRLCCVFC